MSRKTSILYRLTVIAPLLLSFISGGTLSAQDNPVVIQLPGRQVKLDQFNARFEIAVRMLAATQGIKYGTQSQEQIDMLRKQYLRQYGSELVMLQQADKLEVKVNDGQLDSAIADFYHTAGDGKSHEQVLTLIGFRNEGELRQYLADQERIRLVTEKLKEQIVIPPGDVMTMHHDLADQLTVPEKVCMRQIGVEDEQTALRLLNQLKAGADFAALAKEHSIDRKTGPNGGDMGCFEREEGTAARSDFESAAYSANTGEVTGPVKSDLGYHLLLVYERVAAHSPTLNEVYSELENEIRHEKLPDVLADIIDNSGLETFPDRLGVRDTKSP